MGQMIDLHIHTDKSDGKLTPKEIIDEAIKNNISVVSITDHDTIDAYSDELLEYAKKNNIKLIPGVEISTKNERIGIHILGYNINLNNSELISTLSKIKNSRHKYLHDVTKLLISLGYKVNLEKLDLIDTVAKAHIANDIVNNIDNRNILLRTFNHIPGKGEFIETIMNEGCPGYVKKESITPKEAVELIKRSGGIPVLAHPVAYKYEDGLIESDIYKLIKEIGVNIIEANYIYIDRNENKINESKMFKKFAKEHNFLCTIGSDFHNFDGIHPKMGLIGEDINLTQEEIDKILKIFE